MPEETNIVAFVDVGTNSIHMLIVKFYEGSLGTPIYHDKESVRLGRSLYCRGRIDREALVKTKVVLSNFMEIARNKGVSEVRAYATCAAREAPNSDDLSKIVRDCGIKLRIISGMEEARLTRLGVLGIECPQKTLLIDIGGGSTEIALCNGKEDMYLDSLNLGALRMSFGSGIDQSGKLTFKEYDELKRYVDVQSYRSVGKIRSLGFDTAFGSSGTLMALAQICASRRGDNDASYMLYSELESLMLEMCGMTVEERAKIPKLSAGRADIILGGGAIAEELMYLYGVKRLEISPYGLREGMQIGYLLEKGFENIDVRLSSAITLMSRCGCDRSHAESVTEYASKLYDGLKNIGVIDLPPQWRDLLRYAAIVHDVGEFINYDNHSDYSYLIIRNSYLAGFDNYELELMALMAKFHHGSLPSA